MIEIVSASLPSAWYASMLVSIQASYEHVRPVNQQHDSLQHREATNTRQHTTQLLHVRAGCICSYLCDENSTYALNI